MQPSNFLPQLLRTVGAWAVALLLFFPLGWLFLTAFKTELQAIHVPPLFIFEPTLDNFGEVQRRSDYLLYARNSLITSVCSTVLGLLIVAPAAYSMAFFRTRRTRDILMWMLSTKMMPAVGALVPIYVLAQTAGMLDTLSARSCSRCRTCPSWCGCSTPATRTSRTKSSKRRAWTAPASGPSSATWCCRCRSAGSHPAACCVWY